MIYEIIDLKTKDCLYITNDFDKACKWAKVYKEELKIDVLLKVKG